MSRLILLMLMLWLVSLHAAKMAPGKDKFDSQKMRERMAASKVHEKLRMGKDQVDNIVGKFGQKDVKDDRFKPNVKNVKPGQGPFGTMNDSKSPKTKRGTDPKTGKQTTGTSGKRPNPGFFSNKFKMPNLLNKWRKNKDEL